MANEEVLGPRKTMFVLVIVVGCFAVLWPRILSPLILGHTREQLKPNQFDREAALKQERPPVRAGPHPALRERGRAIPAGTPSPPVRPPVTMPPHARVRSSPLEGYFELEIKPPPIPGMRPPLGSPGGPVAAPKSSMGFVMPIYTICIIVFFVYTLSKILFKRTGSTPYEVITPDPQFRRRVFRDDSRTSPDKLVVTAISGLVAEVRQQMEASYAQNQQRQDLQDNHARPYTNGTVLHNTGPVHIVASEYRGASKEKSPEPAKDEPTPEPKEPTPASAPEHEEPVSEPKEPTPEPEVPTPEPKESTPEPKETTLETQTAIPEPKESTPEHKESSPESNESSPEPNESSPEPKRHIPAPKQASSEPKEEEKGNLPETNDKKTHNADLIKLTETENAEEVAEDVLLKTTNEFLDNAREVEVVSAEEFEEGAKEEERTTPDLLEEALKEDSSEKDDEEEQEKPSVKVVGMEVTAHSADCGEYRAGPPAPAPAPAAPPTRAHEAKDVQNIFLETQIPQQARVLVAEFGDQARAQKDHSPMVVSGKMTLSLIQDAPRDTPERDPESTVDDFTTASAVTQPAEEKDEELSDEEIEEEIEIEEIEEEEEDEEEEEPQKAQPQTAPKQKEQK